MCRSNVEKDEVFINQSASGGGSNTARSDHHLSNISIVLYLICTLIGIAGLYALYRLYRGCHHEWIRNEFTSQNLMRSFRRRPNPEASVCYECRQQRHDHQRQEPYASPQDRLSAK